jgi:hypothetical protein
MALGEAGSPPERECVDVLFNPQGRFALPLLMA